MAIFPPSAGATAESDIAAGADRGATTAPIGPTRLGASLGHGDRSKP